MTDERPESTPPSTDAGHAKPRVIEVRYRRAPRFSRFIGTGVFVGLLLAFVLTLVGTGSSWVLLPLAVGLGLVGAMVGGGLAVLADKRSG
ncbi:MAG: hypothetical protein ACLGIA_07200 [Actinomycetes bacterium]